MTSILSKYPFLLYQHNPWIHEHPIWLGSTISLIRNLDKFNFPAKLSIDKKKQIITLIHHALLQNKEIKEPHLIYAEELKPIEKEFLLEHFLSPLDLSQTYSGEAFLLESQGELLTLLNLHDHLHLYWIAPGDTLENRWKRLFKLESALHAALNFAFSPKFGFLTSDHTHCGTGLVLSAFLHLPALNYSGLLEKTINKYKDEGIEQGGIQGNPKDMIGDIVTFYNSYTLGISEEEIFSSLHNLIIKLVIEEKSARNALKNAMGSNDIEMKDAVSRAYGILRNSYKIDIPEAWKHISLIKMAIDIDWIKGISHNTLNALLFNCRRGHLLPSLNKENIEPENFSHLRAEFLHDSLKTAELLI